MLTDPSYEGNTGRTGNLGTPNLILLKMRDYLNRSKDLHDSGTLILLKVDL